MCSISNASAPCDERASKQEAASTVIAKAIIAMIYASVSTCVEDVKPVDSDSSTACDSDKESDDFNDDASNVSSQVDEFEEDFNKRVDIAAWRVAGARVYGSIAGCMQDPEVTAFADESDSAPCLSNSLAYPSVADQSDEILGVKAWCAASTRISRSFVSCLDDPEVTAFADECEDAAHMPSTIIDEKMDIEAVGEVNRRISESIALCIAEKDSEVQILEHEVDVTAWHVAGARVHHSIVECMQDPEVTAFADEGDYAPRISSSLAYSCAADLLDEIAGVKAWSAASTRISRSFVSCLDDPEVTAFADASQDDAQMSKTIIDERMDIEALGDVNRRISESIALCIAEEDSELELVEHKVDVAAWRVAGSRIYGSLLECMEDPEVTAFIS